MGALKGRTAVYQRHMYQTMCKTFFRLRDKDVDVNTAAETVKRKLEKKFPEFKGIELNSAGVRAKCYELRRKGYDYKLDKFIKDEYPTPKKKEKKESSKSIERKFEPATTLDRPGKYSASEDVKVTGYQTEERLVLTDTIKMTVRGVDITMVFK